MTFLPPTLQSMLAAGVLCASLSSAHAGVAQTPLFLGQAVTPLVMFNMSADHQLYFQAYPEYADLDGDGSADRSYLHDVDYYGYFDSSKCYEYSSASERFIPVALSASKYCSGQWSGNFLNWIAMSRIDVVRKILYGGLRSTDTASLTVLERSYLPNDAHSWVRYYDGVDLPQLTPFDLPLETSFAATTANSNPHRQMSTGAKNYTISGANQLVEYGDQVIIRRSGGPLGEHMFGVVTTRNNNNITVQVTGLVGVSGTPTATQWQIEVPSRRGMSFCNTTPANSGYSQNITAAPLIRAARGNYQLWAANERWQCRWQEEKSDTGHTQMRIGTRNFSNGNNLFVTGLAANATNPRRDQSLVDGSDFVARVEACKSGLIGNERCKAYPNGHAKPTGLLQQFGEDGRIHFGLLTGSYTRNLSGGVLRRNIGAIGNEINATSGQFLGAPSGGGVIDALNRLRIYGYSHGDGTYGGSASNGGDNCTWGLIDPAEGRCQNWGNPQAEIFLESLRYLSGANTPTSAFAVSGNDRLNGLISPAWQSPLSEANYCASLNLIHFNSSVTTHDHDQFDSATDLPGLGTLAEWTNKVGAGEGIHGQPWFIGEVGASTNRLCTAKTISSLSEAYGLCPEAPRMRGSYHIAGLAHYAYSEDLRPDLSGKQQVKTFGITLAPAVPRIDIPRPGQSGTAVTILPSCRRPSNGSSCAIVDFKIIEQNIADGTGRFLIQWEDSEQGGDFDMDMNGILAYKITNDQITVTTNIFAQSAGGDLAFGYVISGTTLDGFHAHSGINQVNLDGCSGCIYSDPPTSRSFNLGSSEGELLKEPLYYAAKWGGYDRKKNFPTEPASWDSTGDGTPDNYYFAIDPAQLANDMEAVFNKVAEVVSTAAAVAINSTRLSADSRVFQAKFDSTDWTGELLALPVLADGSLGEVAEWNAAEQIPPAAERQIFTLNPTTGAGIPFLWNSLTTAQQNALDNNEQILAWLRGDSSQEQRNGGDLRDRSRPLGDIVNSDPAYLGRGNFGFGELPGVEGSSYANFLISKINRPNALFIGANDGKLHGFHAETGEELFAYVPASTFPHLASLANPAYQRRYFVDGSPRVLDAYLGSNWKSILISSTGAGGNVVFALDVSDPENFAPSAVLWEFTDADMGYAIPQPTIARLKDGNFYAIFANGYDSPQGKAVLYLRNLNTGTVIKIDTGEGSAANKNGLSSPVPVDTTGDRITDTIYAGDLHGNLWKFDVSASNSNQWNNANQRKRLFIARDAEGRTQPITARPEVGKHPGAGRMIYVGTGSYFRISDAAPAELDDPRHSFYAIHDKDLSGNPAALTRSDLVAQSLLWEGVAFERDLRVVSNLARNDSKSGWYLDLVSPAKGFEGERVVAPAQLRGDRIIFTTLIPSGHPCEFGGSSWLMELDALSGARLDYSVFDLNDDEKFDSKDFVTILLVDEEGNEVEVDVPVSGQRSEEGIIQQPRIVSAGETEYKYAAGSSGQVEVIRERGTHGGRQTWEQLR